jgi:hypothetical protein
MQFGCAAVVTITLFSVGRRTRGSRFAGRTWKARVKIFSRTALKSSSSAMQRCLMVIPHTSTIRASLRTPAPESFVVVLSIGLKIALLRSHDELVVHPAMLHGLSLARQKSELDQREQRRIHSRSTQVLFHRIYQLFLAPFTHLASSITTKLRAANFHITTNYEHVITAPL